MQSGGNNGILAARICDDASATRYVGKDASAIIRMALEEPFGIRTVPEQLCGNQKAVAAVVGLCRLRHHRLAGNSFGSDGVDAVGSNDQIGLHNCAVGKSHGWLLGILQQA
jgi:hypothetical protein